MIDKADGAKPIIDQIIDDMLLSLKTREEFNELVITKISDIASSGSLTSTKKVIDAIKALE